MGSRFKMPSNIEDLRKVVKDYKVMDDPVDQRLKPIIMNKKDNLILKDEIGNTIIFLENMKTTIKDKQDEVQTLLDTENNLSNIENIYKKHSRQMNNEIYDSIKKKSVNKRLVEFYNKDYLVLCLLAY